MTIKVSVVVPVYNPGRQIEGLLDSLSRQTMPADEFETVFVDDGSTDGTPERLEALTAARPNQRVIRIPPSGWPGRPRNVGVDAARGEYVQFVDHDDALGDEALERLWKYATEHHSDVVVGREERRGARMYVGTMFRRNRPRAVLGQDPLLDLLTPHKMFRRAFLLERDVRFLEGPRRLEDHHFVMQAYFRADVISVLADYACYYWIARPGEPSAGSRPYEWWSYYGYVADVLDVVEEHTEPGPFRDRLLAHWYRGKGLRMLDRRIVTAAEEDARTQFAALRALTEERFPPGVDQYLRPLLRLRSQLLRAGDFEGFRDLAHTLRDVTIDHRLDELRTSERGLELQLTATMVRSDGSPLRLERERERLVWRIRTSSDDAAPRHALDFTDCVRRVSLDVVMRNRSTGDTIRLPGRAARLAPGDGAPDRLGAVRTVVLDPRTAHHGGPLEPGIAWALDLQLSGCGFRLQTPMSSPPPADATSTVVLPFAGARGDSILVLSRRPDSGSWHVEARPRRGRFDVRSLRERVRRRPSALLSHALRRLPRARAMVRRLRRAGP